MPPRTRRAGKKSGSDVVRRALLTIGVDETKLSGQDVDRGWRVIRQTFRGACLTKHPDKGGDTAEFSALYESFEVVKCVRNAWISILHRVLLKRTRRKEDQNETGEDDDDEDGDDGDGAGTHGRLA